MIAVVVIYALCWLPLHTITLVGDRHDEIWRFKYIQVVWIVCHWFAMSNCCYNPMVYCWMNSKFRNGFKYVLRCCPCINFENDDHGLCKMKRINTYVTTMRSSLREKRAICTYSSTPTSSRYDSQYTEYSTVENVPLKNLANGTNGSDSRGLTVGRKANKPTTRQTSRVGDQKYLCSDTDTLSKDTEDCNL